MISILQKIAHSFFILNLICALKNKKNCNNRSNGMVCGVDNQSYKKWIAKKNGIEFKYKGECCPDNGEEVCGDDG